MRNTRDNQILQALIEAASQPVSETDLEQSVRLPTRDRLVIPDMELTETFDYDHPAGSAYWELGTPEPLTAGDLGLAISALRREGWIITIAHPITGQRPLPTYQLRGRSALPIAAVPVGAISSPGTLPADRAHRLRLWLLAAGGGGAPHSTIYPWSPDGDLIMDVDVDAAVAELRTAGYEIDSWWEGSTVWWQLAGTPEVPMHRPPVPGTDAAMLPDGEGRVPKLVGATEIAVRSGVRLPTIEAWRRRHATFPAPQWTVGGRPAWDWYEVRQWLAATERRGGAVGRVGPLVKSSTPTRGRRGRAKKREG